MKRIPVTERNDLIVNSSCPHRHPDTIQGTDGGAQSTAIALFPPQRETAVLEDAGAEMTDIQARAAVIALGSIRPLDEPALVAPLLAIQEVAAAVVAAEADPFGDGAILPPAKGPGDEKTGTRLGEDPFGLRAGQGA
jgi:hypothetical protein